MYFPAPSGANYLGCQARVGQSVVTVGDDGVYLLRVYK